MSAANDAFELASRQHGVITWLQLIDIGIHQARISRWIAGGRLEVFAPGTYLVAGSPATWHQRVMASTLAAGPRAAASHRAAAHLLGLQVDRPKQIHVTAPYGTHEGKRYPFVVHRARTLGPLDVRVVDSIPVTCVERTLVDLAGTVPPKTLAACLDTALLKGLTTIDRCRGYIEDRNLTHRKGAGRLRQLLRDRETGVPESQLEREFLDLVDEEHLPVPERQGSRGPYRIDFIYPEHGILIEVDGRAWHGNAQAFEDDHVRRNELSLNGYRHAFTFTWLQVTTHPDYVARTIRQALSSGRALITQRTSP